MLSKGIDSETFSLITNAGSKNVSQMADTFVIEQMDEENPNPNRPTSCPNAMRQPVEDPIMRPSTVPDGPPVSDFISFDYDPPIPQTIATASADIAAITTHEMETQVCMSKPSTARSSLEHIAQPNGDRFRMLISKLNTLLREDCNRQEAVEEADSATNAITSNENPPALTTTSSGWFMDSAQRHEYYNPYRAVNVPANKPSVPTTLQPLHSKLPPPASIFTTPQQPPTLSSPDKMPQLPHRFHANNVQQTALTPTKNGAGDELSTAALTTNIELSSQFDTNSTSSLIGSTSEQQPLNLKISTTAMMSDSTATPNQSINEEQIQHLTSSTSVENISQTISGIRFRVKLNQRSSLTQIPNSLKTCASDQHIQKMQLRSARKERLKRIGLVGIYGVLFTVMVSASAWPQMQCIS